jgi:hypothetical protein
MLSIFEEWRLGGEGQHIESGQAAYQGGSDPDVISQVPEEKISHKPHIWQYTDKMIKDLIWSTGWKIIEFSKEPECIHQGHMWWNWFVILERPEIWPANKFYYPGDPVNHFPPAMLEQIMGQKAIA